MKMSSLTPLLIAACIGPALAATTTEETLDRTQEASESAIGHAAHHAHGRRAPKKVVLGDTTGARITFWHPDLETRSLTAQDRTVVLPRTGVAAYYAVVAEWDRPAEKAALIRYEYLRGRPTDHSPRELLSAAKTELEIVPDPLPREHYRYYANDRWGFGVRFRGEPLAGAAVSLTTAHGSAREAQTDAEGRVNFVLPDDFPEVRPGRDANAPGEMTLGVEHATEGVRYATRLSAAYHADPGHWQSVSWGTGVAALGVLAGFAGSLRGRNHERGAGK